MFGVLLLAWREWLETYFNYPGLEAWKFLNLAIFILVMVKIAGKPLGAALESSSERIENELVAAQKEKDAAQASLTEVDSLLARREDDISNIAARARQEAAEEKERLANVATSEIEKLKIQVNEKLTRLEKLPKKLYGSFLLIAAYN